MIATQKFSCMIFRTPQKDVWCTYGVRYEHAPNFFNPEKVFTAYFETTVTTSIRGTFGNYWSSTKKLLTNFPNSL